MITKQQFDSLFDPETPRPVYHDILDKIDDRFCEICRKFFVEWNINSSWYDYSTGGKEGEQGIFDPVKYKDFTNLCAKEALVVRRNSRLFS